MQVGYRITEATNFLRVFRLPKAYPQGFCFNGGYACNFQLIDWFNPFSTQEVYADVSITVKGDEYIGHIDMLKDFIRAKVYATSDMLAVTDYGDAFIIKADKEIPNEPNPT